MRNKAICYPILLPNRDNVLGNIRTSMEVGPKSPGQALTLLSEDGPNFIGRALSEVSASSLGVQDFWCRPPYTLFMYSFFAGEERATGSDPRSQAPSQPYVYVYDNALKILLA